MSMLGDVLRKLEELGAKPAGPMTRKEFAALVKRSPRTIHRWIEQKKVRLQNDLIPASESRRFLS
jgi:hypothetical protein